VLHCHQSTSPGTKATYLHVVCAFWPEKEIPHCIIWTVGGDCIDYTGNVSTKTADLSTVKILFNSIISMPNAQCMMGNLKDFYLGMPMEPKDYAYRRIPVSMLPTNIMDYYQLHALVHNGHVYVKIQCGMYGLPQAGLLANHQLQQFLEPHGYAPCTITPGLWCHHTLPIAFALVVDDFTIKYTNWQDAVHLMSALQQHYKVSKDWTATCYCGLTIAWDYDNCTINLSMPGYIECTLLCFSHPPPACPEHSLHAWQKPKYRAKVQYADPPTTAPFLDAADTKCIQEVVGVLLYYTCTMDSTLLTALGTIATQQAKGTQATMEAITQLLN